ncbi:MAG: family 20 glycosylhydrolase [Candidatus Omnitrophica bacterium]|nr:family 20 glycosylhydrolase [Candidatus Omnitrophota bacterium]MBU4478283.1 family 20 glycosylhydrolase [Candidatus Omnitrophota bacterium]MCG2703351.1 hypothetical protein [Candidatus Omnitrophota bacterium]
MKKFTTKFNYKFLFMFCVANIFFLLALTLQSGLSEKNISIVPQPQHMEFKNFKVKVDKNWDISVNTSNKENIFSAKLLNEKLNNKLMITDINSKFQTRRIILAMSKDNFKEKKELRITDKIGKEGYVLEVFPSSIVITAHTSAGVFYGVQALLQLMEVNGNVISIPGVKIVDYPDTAIRAVHMLDLQGSLNELKEKLDFIAGLRINTVIFSEQAFWKLEKDNLQPGRENSSFLQELFAYCRERHIEPIPELQSFGVALTILQKDPHAAEGIWVQDEPFKWINNMAVPVKSSEVFLENSGFEIGGVAGIPAGWTFGNEYGRNDWCRDKTSAYEGRCSVMINVPSPLNISSNTLQSKLIMVDRDTAYTLSFYAKKREVNTAVDRGFAIRIFQYDRSGNFLVENYLPLQYANTSWEKLEFNFVTRPDTAKIYIGASIIDGYGTVWLDEFKLKRMNGELVNVIRTESSNISITDSAKTKIYTEGKDYRVFDGEIKHPYFVNYNRPARIERLETGKINENEPVLISYDFVLRFHPATWMTPYCPSEPRTYKIFFKTVNDIIHLLKPNYIAIGHDDIYGIGRDSRCKKRNMTLDKLLSEDINKLNDYIHTIDSNVKMMVWDDMFNPWHTGGKNNFQMHYGGLPGKSCNAINLISKDIILMTWWFDSNDHMNKMKNTPDCFKSKGFSYLVTGWKDKKNIKNWIRIVKDNEECKGIIVTTWDGWDNNIEGIEYTAKLSWSGQ